MSTATFRNPLLPDGPDPWMVFHEGYYYLTYSAMDRIEIRRAASLAEIGKAQPVVVWQENEPSRDQEMWAPEFYLLDGPNGRRWYLYFTASDGVDINHRMHVLESEGQNPLGSYSYKAQLKTDAKGELYAIDAGLIQRGNGELFCVWAGHPDHRLFISHMENPWTLAGERQLLEADGFGCDEVREGPVALRRNGKIFLVYSICDTGKPDYKVGMLVADENADLMNPHSWTQHPEPIFSRNDDAGVYGPGHNGFFHSPDGSETWIIYHAKAESRYTYEGRSPRAQKIAWDENGIPRLGRPLSLDTDILVPSGDPA